MARLEVRYRPSIYNDLEELFLYIWESSGLPRTAKAFVDGIDDRCQQIGDFPESGRLRNDLREGLRIIPYKSVVIAYVVRSDHLLIINIVHSARDYEAVLRGERA